MNTNQKNKPGNWIKGIGYGLLLIVIFYAIQFAIMIPIIAVYTAMLISQNGAALAMDPESLMTGLMESGVLTVVTAAATVVTAIVFGLWYYLKYGRKSDKKLGETLKYSFTGKRTVLYIVASVFTYLMALDVVAVINLISPSSVGAYTELMQQISSGSQGLLLVTVTILAPIGEECLFRGLLLKKLGKYMPAAAAIVIQAVLFGVFHMNVVQGFYVLALGLLCGYAAYQTHSVLPAIFMHLVHNSMSFVIQLLPESLLSNDLVWVVAPLIPLAIGCSLFHVWGFCFDLKEPVNVEVKEKAIATEFDEMSETVVQENTIPEQEG